MKEKEVTIDYMLNLFQKLSEAGYGEMIVKCGEDAIHEDEITINYMTNEMIIRGHLYNNPIVESMRTFINSVKEAEEKFYFDVNRKNNETP